MIAEVGLGSLTTEHVDAHRAKTPPCWSVDVRYQPTDQATIVIHVIGFLARSRRYPKRVATLGDWLALRLEHDADST